MPLKNKLVPHDPAWSAKFDSEAHLLREVFGPSARAIHHVGSTSIEGIYAKPEIDIHVELDTTRDIERFSDAMARLGYRVRGEEVEAGSHYYSKDEDGIRTFKVHASGSGHPSLTNQLLFRNYLRKHPACAQQYSDLKRQLAEANKTGIIEYLDGKRPFILETLARAAAEREHAQA